MIEAGAASVRAERSGTGNGRVYQISFTADDGKGAPAPARSRSASPIASRKGLTAIDDGQLYDSTIP